MAYELKSDPRSSHQRVARYVRRVGRGPILDVGAATGQLARLLAGTGLPLDGVEPDPAMAEEARPLYRRLHVGAIEEVDLPTSTYEIVVCADVLEHTVDPTSVLRRLIAASTPGATFLISLPNVAHIAARALLLAGRFPQHDRGIFDRTHLHFYTRSTALALVRSGGLAVRSVGATPVPLETVWPERLGPQLLEFGMRMQMAAIRVAPTAFAFQWLILAGRQ